MLEVNSAFHSVGVVNLLHENFFVVIRKLKLYLSNG